MKIKSISIKDFRNITRSEVEFGRLNVLTGRNSSGKSNFLLALATSLDTAKDYNEVYSGNTVTLGKGKRLASFETVIDDMRGRMICYMLNPGAFCIDPKSFTFEKTVDKQSLAKSHKLFFTGRQYEDTKLGANLISKVMEKFDEYGTELINSPVYQEEFTQDEQEGNLKVVKRDREEKGEYYNYFKQLREEIVCNLNADRPSTAINASAIHEYVTEKGDDEIYKQVLQNNNQTTSSLRQTNLKKSKFIFLISDIHKNPDVSKKFESDLKLYTKGVITKISIDKKGALAVTCPNGPEEIWSISSGTSVLIFFITLINWLNLTHRQRTYRNPSILILDEIDTIIHPTILVDFIEILRKASEKIQIFITTHSPYFLDSFVKDEIYFLKDASTMHDRVEDLSNRYNITSYKDIFDVLPSEQKDFFATKKHSELLINGTIEGLFPGKKSND